MSTVGIDGDPLYGMGIPGADEYLLAIEMVTALFVILIAAWMLYPRLRYLKE